MNPGEVWRLQDGSLRLVVSHPTYNASQLNRVITAVVDAPKEGFDPFAVSLESPEGQLHVYADRIAMHPRHWLVEQAAAADAQALGEVRRHLRFLLCDA